MFISDVSIKRPVFASVLMLSLVTLGIFSYRRLSIDMFPNIEIPVISIVTIFPGASPETVEREVSRRIEEAVNPITGVKHVYSSSLENVSSVVVEFDLEVKINEASQEARAKINAIRGDLPQGIEDPVIQKLDFAGMPVVSLAVRSDTVSPRELSTLVDKKIRRWLENIPGVGKVEIVGASKREVNVEVEPSRLDSLGMGVDEVILGLMSENVDAPMGRLEVKNLEYPLRLSGKPRAVEQFGTMVIGQRQGLPVRLGDVAVIKDGIEEQRSLALINNVPAVAMNVLKQSGANTVGVVDAVKKEIARMTPDLPPGVRCEVVRDSSIMIRDSIRDVQETLIWGGLLTILIVFLFLNSWRSTVITGLTLPVSVISSFIIMNFLGMTLNVITLMALSLAIGMLIDDAIVVRENIVRHLQMGKDHFTAAREATNEIGLAVLATTMSIVAVFVPVAFMKGIIGRIFFQFGMTVTFAVLVSLLVSFTLDPMLSSRWYDPSIEKKGKRGFITRMLDRFEHGFDAAADKYRFVIAWALDHRKTIILMTLAAFFGGLFLFGRLESSFIPTYDQGEFQINFKTAPGSSIRESSDRLQKILADLKQVPEIDHNFATIGAGDTGTVRDGSVYIKLAEMSARHRKQPEIQRVVRGLLAKIPGITSSLAEPGNMGGQKPLMVGIRGEDLELLKKYSRELKDAVADMPGIVDLEMSLDQDLPEYQLFVDRERARSAGVMTANIVQTLSTLVGGRAVTTYEDESGDAIDVRLRLPENLRQTISQIQDLRLSLPAPTGAPSLITIGDLVHYQIKNSPAQIDRQELNRQITISANLDGTATGTAAAMVQKALDKISMLPGYKAVFSGEVEQMEESFRYMAEALLLAVIMVYLILAAQFESFIDPLAIMLSLPLAIVGMAGMLVLTGDVISIMSLIGLIMLMGLVTKNAILLVDYSKVLQSRGLPRREALIEAGRTRLRPIMMTTLAMIFGMFPLALALGSGAEMRAPMARAVIGGLITSTMLTLIVVPVIYSILNDFGLWLHKRWFGDRHVGRPVEELEAQV